MGEGGSRSERTTRYEANIKVNGSRKKRPGKDRCGRRRGYKERRKYILIIYVYFT